MLYENLSISGETTPEPLKFIERICEELGLDNLAYGAIDQVTGFSRVYTTNDPEWPSCYYGNGHFQTDPVLGTARRSITPVDFYTHRENPNYKRLFRDASDFNLPENGVIIPIWGVEGDLGLLSATRHASEGEWKKIRKNILGDLQTAAVQVHDLVRTTHFPSQRTPAHNLTDREAETLQWIAAGKTNTDIGDILGLAVRTVETHSQSARQKLKAISTPQAIGRAIALGIIEPA